MTNLKRLKNRLSKNAGFSHQAVGEKTAAAQAARYSNVPGSFPASVRCKALSYCKLRLESCLSFPKPAQPHQQGTEIRLISYSTGELVLVHTRHHRS